MPNGVGTPSCCRIWLPDAILVAGETLKGALAGTTESNFAHLEKKYPQVRFLVQGIPSSLSPGQRLHLEAQCGDPSLLEEVEEDLVDLAETACDVAADALGMSDDQVQEVYEAIRVERGQAGLAPEQMQAAAARLGKRGGSRRPGISRADRAAALAQTYFVPSRGEEAKEESASKRQKVDAEHLVFAPEVLEKAPDNLQTIRSLLQFLEKKLQAALPAAPEAWPKDLRAQLHAHGDRVGRLSSLRDTGGWDARSKRVLDISAVVKTGAGDSLLEGADEALERGRGELEKQLKERGESSLDACLAERIAWAKDCLRRDWLRWCARLLKAREAALTKGPTPAAGAIRMSFAGILEGLLAGEASGS